MQIPFKIENEHHKLMNNLSKIRQYFEEDLNQIEMLVREQDSSEKIQLESAKPLLDTYKRHLLTANEREDGKVYLENDGEIIEFPKESLEYIVEIISNKVINEERNENFKKSISFIHLATLLDGTIADFLREVLRVDIMLSMPYSIKNGNVVFDSSQHHFNYLEVLKSKSIDELKDAIVERKVDKFGRKSIEEKYLFFERILRTNFPNSYSMIEQIFPYNEMPGEKDFKKRSEDYNKYMLEILIEIVETRNIHVYNRGMVNSIYLSKTNAKNWTAHGISNGKYRVITNEYLSQSIDFCKKLIASLADALTNKFTSEPSRIAVNEKFKFWKERSAKLNK